MTQADKRFSVVPAIMQVNVNDKNNKIVGEGYISQLIMDSKRLNHTIKKRDSMDFSEFAGGTVQASKHSTPLRGPRLNLKLNLEQSYRINSINSARTLHTQTSKL